MFLKNFKQFPAKIKRRRVFYRIISGERSSHATFIDFRGSGAGAPMLHFETKLSLKLYLTNNLEISSGAH